MTQIVAWVPATAAMTSLFNSHSRPDDRTTVWWKKRFWTLTERHLRKDLPFSDYKNCWLARPCQSNSYSGSTALVKLSLSFYLFCTDVALPPSGDAQCNQLQRKKLYIKMRQHESSPKHLDHPLVHVSIWRYSYRIQPNYLHICRFWTRLFMRNWWIRQTPLKQKHTFIHLHTWLHWKYFIQKSSYFFLNMPSEHVIKPTSWYIWIFLKVKIYLLIHLWWKSLHC